MSDRNDKARRKAQRGIVTLRDVAQVAGVSAQTVSCVVNDNGSISEPIREKVRKIAADLGYLPNLSAKAMRTGRSQTIGLVISEIRVPFFPEFAYEVQRAALRHRYSVLIIDCDESPRQMKERIATLKSMAVGGVITTESVPALFNLRLPTVMVASPRKGLDCVTSDDAAGGAMIADHLLARGHRKIGLVTSPRKHCIPERREALLQRLRGRAKVVWEVMTPASELITEDIRRKFRSIDVSAVVCSHDLIAIGLLRALWEMGVSVPNDISVVGYDDVQWAAVVSPGLTTVRQPFASLADRSVEFLIDRINHPRRRPRRWSGAVTLVERETVADLTLSTTSKFRSSKPRRNEPSLLEA
jgi:LacI family transcriptional regulator